MRAALDRRTAKKWLPGAFEVCELHVHPDHQSRGLGRRLLHALVADLPHPAALLSTPDADTKAFRLYHADGFVDLARGYHFPGDARPFAILGARLPLRPARAGPGDQLSVTSPRPTPPSTSSSSAPATTGWSRPATWPGPDCRSRSWSPTTSSAARSPPSSAGPACGSTAGRART